MPSIEPGPVIAKHDCCLCALLGLNQTFNHILKFPSTDFVSQVRLIRLSDHFKNVVMIGRFNVVCETKRQLSLVVEVVVVVVVVVDDVVTDKLFLSALSSRNLVLSVNMD